MTSTLFGYREHSPSPPLRGLVESYWSFSGSYDGVKRVLPDGCADLLLDRKTGKILVVGTMTRALLYDGRGEQDLVAVRFRPGGAGALLGLSMSACVDISAPWDDRAADELLERAGEATPSELRRELDELLLGRLAAVSTAAHRRAALAQRCLDSPDIAVSALAEQLGVSRQHLGREVLSATGVRPKVLARIGRLCRATKAIADGHRPSVDTALDAGFCDQSHMVNEFRALAGVTPGGYARGLSGPASMQGPGASAATP